MINKILTTIAKALRPLPALEDVRQAIYVNCYPDPTSERIQPLSERAQWEQAQVTRQAEAVLALFK